MSFRTQPPAPARPNRCQLFGPGSRPALFEKMAASAADVINLDLEDSVAPDDKPEARKNIVQAIGDIDWGNKYLSVRINGLDTPFWYRDVVELLEQAGDRIDQIMIPKVGCAADVYAVDALVTAIEAAKGRRIQASHQIRGCDEDAVERLHLRQQFIDLPDLPTPLGAGAVLQEAIRLVDKQQRSFIARCREGTSDVLLGLTRPHALQLGRALDVQGAIQHLR